MQVGWSYIKDTEDFLKKIKRLGKIPEGTVLVKRDAVGLYLNILHGFGLQYLKKRINETGIFKLPTTKSEYKINHNFNCNSKCLISCCVPKHVVNNTLIKQLTSLGVDGIITKQMLEKQLVKT